MRRNLDGSQITATYLARTRQRIKYDPVEFCARCHDPVFRSDTIRQGKARYHLRCYAIRYGDCKT